MVSHGVGPGLDGLRPGAVRASGGDFAVFRLGHGASRAVGRGWICGRTGPLGLMVERRHEAWQGVSVTKSHSHWQSFGTSLSEAKCLPGLDYILR